MFERIVVGYAGDRAGRDAVVLASQLAAISGAELTVVFPYHPLFATVPASVAEERVRGELRRPPGRQHRARDGTLALEQRLVADPRTARAGGRSSRPS